jgi:vancomycin permeability regulator SanA
MRRRRGNRLKILAILAAIPILGMGAISYDGLTDDVKQSDVAIVLGNSIAADGNPSPWLKGRLDRSLGLYRKGLAPNIIVSGGPEANGFDEATVMKAYLVSKGVPADRIVADSAGVTTMATARNGADIMRQRGWKGAIAVSQFYHITRTRLALRAYGVSPVYGAHAHYFDWRDAWSLPRELAANVSYRWRLWRDPPPR